MRRGPKTVCAGVGSDEGCDSKGCDRWCDKSEDNEYVVNKSVSVSSAGYMLFGMLV